MFSRISDFFRRLFQPSQPNVVPFLVAKTAGLELAKDEYRLLAPPSSDVYGSVSLTGNSLPTFHYTVFDKELMDFVLVRIEIALPDRISFVSKLIPTQHQKQDGRPESLPDLVEIPLKPAYVVPGEQLLNYLAAYFPLIKAGT